MAVKGIIKALEDESTGAPISFFRLVHYHVDKRSNTCYGLLAGYVSEAKFDDGKNPMSTVNVTVNEVPPIGVDTESWLCEQIILPAAPEAPENVLAGGTLVHYVEEE